MGVTMGRNFLLNRYNKDCTAIPCLQQYQDVHGPHSTESSCIVAVCICFHSIDICHYASNKNIEVHDSAKLR